MPISVQPGQIWWCNGTYLGFDRYLKTRPVLILGKVDHTARVAILTSKSQLGSVEIRHRKGSSYLTGRLAEVPLEALVDYLDTWSGFEEFQSKAASPYKTGCQTIFVTLSFMIILLFCLFCILRGF